MQLDCSGSKILHIHLEKLTPPEQTNHSEGWHKKTPTKKTKKKNENNNSEEQEGLFEKGTYSGQKMFLFFLLQALEKVQKNTAQTHHIQFCPHTNRSPSSVAKCLNSNQKFKTWRNEGKFAHFGSSLGGFSFNLQFVTNWLCLHPPPNNLPGGI